MFGGQLCAQDFRVFPQRKRADGAIAGCWGNVG
jgi:hypothetical protein